MSSKFVISDPAHVQLVQLCRDAKRVAVLTGAGISAESGLATFRGSEGIWSKFRPEELASMSAFLRNPERVWEWYSYRREVLATARPNAAHIALAQWESMIEEFTLMTQNVDGLHALAGTTNLVELHGNLKVNRCLECGAETSLEEIAFEGKVPRCRCGGMLRPGVVWFGEMLPERAISRAFAAAEACDLFLVIGTSAVVYPAASLPEVAREAGSRVVEINPEATPVSDWADYSLRFSAGEVVPQIVASLLASSRAES